MSSKYEQNANCMRLARETDDAVLSFGYMKIAEAWLELDKRCRAKRRLRARSLHTKSRQVNRRARLSSYGTIKRSRGALKPTKRRIRSSSSY
jgi:hypothetical protein